VNTYLDQEVKRLCIQECFFKILRKMSNTSTTELLKEALVNEAIKFPLEESKLFRAYAKFLKMGIDTKSTYDLPLKDTIGKTFREQLQFKAL